VSGTPVGLALATFGPSFGSPVRDQLVNQALVRGHVSEQAAKPRSRCAASLYLRIGELGGLSHARRISAATALRGSFLSPLLRVWLSEQCVQRILVLIY
jgi:hypothetical protein